MPKSKVREEPTVKRQLRSVNISLLQQTASVGPKRESQEDMRVQISIYIWGPYKPYRVTFLTR